MEKRRVVITGLGTVNPLGNTTSESWALRSKTLTPRRSWIKKRPARWPGSPCWRWALPRRH